MSVLEKIEREEKSLLASYEIDVAKEFEPTNDFFDQLMRKLPDPTGAVFGIGIFFGFLFCIMLRRGYKVLS